MSRVAPRALLPITLVAVALALAPAAGATLAYVKDGKAHVAGDDGSGAQAVGAAKQVELAPGGFELAVGNGAAGAARRVAVIDLATTERREISLKNVTSFDWLGADTLVVATTTRLAAFVWLVRDGVPERVFRQKRDCLEPGCDFPSLTVAGSPDGTLIALFGTLSPSLTAIRPDGSRAFRLAPPQQSAYQVTAAAWAPDSSALALAELETYDDGYRLAVVGRNGKRSQLVRSSYFVDFLVWSPDAMQIGYVLYDGDRDLMKLHRWELATQRSYRQQAWVSPDAGGLGAWIGPTTWLVGYAGAVNAVDVTTGNALAIVKTKGDFDWQP